MATLGVVEHLDVIEDISPGILPGWVNLAANPLALEQLEETLSHSVVMTVAPATHAADQIVIPKEPLPIMACELTALVRMHQYRVFWLPAPQSHQQSIEHQFCVNTCNDPAESAQVKLLI